MTTSYYSIDDGNGDQLATGLSERTARKVAQRMADERGASVYLYETVNGDAGDYEQVDPTVVA